LDLDAHLSKYLPKPYIEGDTRLDQITARYVLSHRTGLRNWRGNENALTIHFTPGERFSYSGEGFVYLQKVVEQITGKPLNEYMTEAVFVPLGMTSSSYVRRPDFDVRTAMPHDGAGQSGEKFKPKEANAASSLHTTAGDYASFVEAVLNGTGLKPKTLREMERPQIAVDPECTNCTERVPKEVSKSVFWGLGVGIQETAQGEIAVALGRQWTIQVLCGGLSKTENRRGAVHGWGERAFDTARAPEYRDWGRAASLALDQIRQL